MKVSTCNFSHVVVSSNGCTPQIIPLKNMVFVISHPFWVAPPFFGNLPTWDRPATWRRHSVQGRGTCHGQTGSTWAAVQEERVCKDSGCNFSQWIANDAYLVGGLNPSEKSESQLGWWNSQYMGKLKNGNQTSNQIANDAYGIIMDKTNLLWEQNSSKSN